jgi:hypothetical protein
MQQFSGAQGTAGEPQHGSGSLVGPAWQHDRPRTSRRQRSPQHRPSQGAGGSPQQGTVAPLGPQHVPPGDGHRPSSHGGRLTGRGGQPGPSHGTTQQTSSPQHSPPSGAQTSPQHSNSEQATVAPAGPQQTSPNPGPSDERAHEPSSQQRSGVQAVVCSGVRPQQNSPAWAQLPSPQQRLAGQQTRSQQAPETHWASRRQSLPFGRSSWQKRASQCLLPGQSLSTSHSVHRLKNGSHSPVQQPTDGHWAPGGMQQTPSGRQTVVSKWMDWQHWLESVQRAGSGIYVAPGNGMQQWAVTSASNMHCAPGQHVAWLPAPSAGHDSPMASQHSPHVSVRPQPSSTAPQSSGAQAVFGVQQEPVVAWQTWPSTQQNSPQQRSAAQGRVKPSDPQQTSSGPVQVALSQHWPLGQRIVWQLPPQPSSSAHVFPSQLGTHSQNRASPSSGWWTQVNPAQHPEAWDAQLEPASRHVTHCRRSRSQTPLQHSSPSQPPSSGTQQTPSVEQAIEP